MTKHIHIYLSKPAKVADAVASSRVRAHSQFTQADYDYLRGKGWTDTQILKRWDEEAGKGVAPQKGNKNAKPGEAGYMSAFKDASSVAQIEKEIAQHERLLKSAGEKAAPDMQRKLAFLKEELAKAKAQTDDAKDAGDLKEQVRKKKAELYEAAKAENRRKPGGEAAYAKIEKELDKLMDQL